MKPFQTEYFILLEDDELKGLATAKNRDDYQPDLKYFLNATKRLKMLRLLSFTPKEHEWVAPYFP